MLGLLLTALALAAEPTLPTLQAAVPAVYPAEALEAGESASVLLQLDVDATGQVVDVVVLESAGDAFDSAAIAAMYDFAWNPAMDGDGNAAGARIQYRYVFSPDTAPLLSTQGDVLGPDGPMQDVTVRATSMDGTTRTSLTDAEGHYAFAGLADGTWTIDIIIPGYEQETAALDIVSGRVSEVVFRPVIIEETPDDADLVIRVSAPRRTPEITERALTQDEIRYLPGTGGDVVRAIQNLPGVARPPLNIGQLLIRGTSPEDSAYYVDGVRIPIVFHFSGLSTVVAGDSLEEVVFFPGNFGPRYGNILGGGVDLRFDPVLPEETNGFVSIDVFQATIFHEQKIGENTALTISGRRSWVDAILNPILKGGSSTIQAPRYYDGQLRLVHETESNGTLDALVFFSDDRFSIIGGEEDDPNAFGISLATTFQKARLSWRRTTADGWRAETTLLAGPEAEIFEIRPAGQAFEKAFAVGLRHEISRPLTGGGRLVLGLDSEVRRDSLLYDIAAFGATEEVVTWRFNPAVYVEPTFVTGNLRVSPGMRFDPLIQSDGFGTIAVDPRIGARYEAGATGLRASFGRYSQFPTTRQVAEIGSQSNLRPASSWQSSVGVNQPLGPFFSLDATAFYNRLNGIVVGREDTFRFFSGPPPIGPFDTDPYANDGTGQVLGAEMQLRMDTDSTTAWVSATVSRSTRVNRPGDDTRLFGYDQPIILTAVSTTELGKGWRIGGRVRYGSGNPFTPVVNRIYSLDKREFTPIYGPVDSARLPGFFSLDARIDKQWTFGRWDFSMYLDLQNATNAQNPEVMSWNYDFSEETPITSLPTIPVLGFRADW